MTLPRPCDDHNETPCPACHAGFRHPRACELHGIRLCGICHRHEGQCDRGDCTNNAEVQVEQPDIPSACGKYTIKPSPRLVCRRCAIKLFFFGQAVEATLPADLRRLTPERVRELAIGDPRAWHVLDVGCGDGVAEQPTRKRWRGPTGPCEHRSRRAFAGVTDGAAMTT